MGKNNKTLMSCATTCRSLMYLNLESLKERNLGKGEEKSTWRNHSKKFLMQTVNEYILKVRQFWAQIMRKLHRDTSQLNCLKQMIQEKKI